MSDSQISPNEFNPNLDRITEREVVPDFFSRLFLGKPINNSFESGSTTTCNIINSEYKAFNTLNKTLQILPMDLITRNYFMFINTTYIPPYSLNGHVYIVKKIGENYNDETLYRAIEVSTGSNITSLFNRISANDNNEDPNYRGIVVDILINNGIEQSEAEDNAEAYVIYKLDNDIPYTTSDGILLFWIPQDPIVTN